VLEIVDAPAPAVEVRDDGPGPGRGPGGSEGCGLEIVRSLAAECGAGLTLAPRPGGGTTARVEFGTGALAAHGPETTVPRQVEVRR
jgi:two-component sensor histidine kinase